MARPHPRVFVSAATRYLRTHPDELLRAARGAFGLRFGVPLDALRFVASQLLTGKKAPRDVVIESRPPGLRFGATVRQMGTTLRAQATLFIEDIETSHDSFCTTCRIEDVSLEVLDGEGSPLAGLIRSGTLDLSKPGKFVGFLPKRPEFLVAAEDDRVVIDLMKIPNLKKNPTFRRVLGVLSPVIRIASITTSDDHLDVQLRAEPSRIGEAVAAARVA
jgi:hypothetical protein